MVVALLYVSIICQVNICQSFVVLILLSILCELAVVCKILGWTAIGARASGSVTPSADT